MKQNNHQGHEDTQRKPLNKYLRDTSCASWSNDLVFLYKNWATNQGLIVSKEATWNLSCLRMWMAWKSL